MGQRKDVKLRDIAQELGISVVSVSNVLHGKKGVSDSLRERVLQKAEELGYQMVDEPKHKEGRAWHIGILIAERYIREYPSFYMEIYRQVAQLAARRGCKTVLEVVDEEKEQLNRWLMPFGGVTIHGGIFIGEMNPGYVSKVKESVGVPVVCVDFYNAEGDLDYIVTNSYRGMQILTQKLIDNGHRRIGFVGTVHATGSIMDRYMGYCKALQMNGLTEWEQWVIADREMDGYGYLVDFQLPGELPTAFACNCDKSAYVLMEKLKRRGLRVPEDVSVVGFDHFYPLSGGEWELVTYECDFRAMAQVSVNTLLKRIERKKQPEGIQVIEGRVIPGNTIKKLD